MLIPVEPPSRPVDPARFALFDLGFRPFYLLAGAHAAYSAAQIGTESAAWAPASR